MLSADLRSAARALATDIACILAFCIMGRRSHAEEITLDGIAQTAWPFLSGTLLGWMMARGWNRPTALFPTGLTVWSVTVIVGMLLRKATSQGVATSFVVVATLATGVLLLGWRALLTAREGRRRRRSGS